MSASEAKVLLCATTSVAVSWELPDIPFFSARTREPKQSREVTLIHFRKQFAAIVLVKKVSFRAALRRTKENLI